MGSRIEYYRNAKAERDCQLMLDGLSDPKLELDCMEDPDAFVNFDAQETDWMDLVSRVQDEDMARH